MSIREVKITDEEAAAVGVTTSTHANTWGPLIAPLLIAKGVPAAYVQPGDRRCGIIRRDLDGCVFGVQEE